MIKILVVGDIVGNTGRMVVKKLLPQFSRNHNLDMIIANGENAAGGNGITKEIAEELFKNANVITMGNHVWDKKEILSFIDSQQHLIRPANYPPGTPGKGYTIYKLKDNIKVGVVNISGVIFLPPLTPPFLIIDKIITQLKKEECSIIIVDFHAEATSEKIAMGWYLDGKVTAVLGTHTHVQTADERILPGGTAYITDLGMTGPRDSVLGVKKEIAINKFLTQMPVKFETADGLGQLNGVILTVDPETGNATSITRIQEFI